MPYYLENTELYDEYEELTEEEFFLELSRAVKLSDLTNNMDLSRLKKITEVDKKRLEKYKKAYKYLKEQD